MGDERQMGPERLEMMNDGWLVDDRWLTDRW